MTPAKVIPAAAYVRSETIGSILFAIGFSLAFFVLIFDLWEPVMVGGIGGYAFDYLPQFFMIALMTVLVPGWQARRKLLAGKVERLAGSAVQPALPHPRLPRALMLALAFGSVGAIIWFVGERLWPEVTVNWWLAAAVKLAAGGLVAGIVTPLSLRVELSRP